MQQPTPIRSTPSPTSPPPTQCPADDNCPTCGDRELPLGQFCPDGGPAAKEARAGWARYGQRLQQYRSAWAEVGVPTAWAEWELATWPFERDTALWQGVQQYYADWQPGSSMLLMGPTGGGKTGLAVGLMREILRRAVIQGHSRFRARFVATQQLLRRLRDGYSDGHPESRVLGPYLDCDLLVLDDLGMERASDWSSEQLGSIIYERHSQRRAMIVTSNYSLEELEGRFGSGGERFIRRLGEMCG